jgi:hypothetical protein
LGPFENNKSDFLFFVGKQMRKQMSIACQEPKAAVHKRIGIEHRLRTEVRSHHMVMDRCISASQNRAIAI